MTCEDTQRELTSYLDGELDVDRGRAVRGHLRGCAPCRTAAHSESILRDGLRSLPTLDPPAPLWSGVRRRLAEAEVADARRPRWRRVVAGWGRPVRGLGLALGGVAIAMGIAVWHAMERQMERQQGQPTVAVLSSVPVVDRSPCSSGEPHDVALALASEPTCVTEAYAAAAADLMRTAHGQRAQWDNDRRARFDAQLDKVRRDVEVAPEGRPRQSAYRAMIRFLQRVTTRDGMLADARGVR